MARTAAEAADQSDMRGDLRALVRLGVVSGLDLAAGRCVVELAEGMTTGPIPWAAARAGAIRVWAPPSPGEQVLVLAPEGDLERAVAMGALFCDPAPAPADHAGIVVAFDDGAVFAYDPAALALSVALPAGGAVQLTAPGGVAIQADVQITGNLTIDGELQATGEVTAAGIPLSVHKHRDVSAGTAKSGTPVAS